ncbi:hypothetical protein FOA52_005200 [Chlamydomonas sp. UWO 241]|nr:hypothetical protein FOA52_005200 [Chlamydomonas sp. UWO 241]
MRAGASRPGAAAIGYAYAPLRPAVRVARVPGLPRGSVRPPVVCFGGLNGSPAPSAGSSPTSASTSASATSPATASMTDVSISPLKVALEFAEAKLTESTAVKEALEAEAQRVAEVAVEAVSAAAAARETMDSLEAVKNTSSIEPAQDDTLSDQIEAAMTALLNAEAAAADAEEVAAAAMKACELAVKEEMQARTVVKETILALEKTLAAISDDEAATDSPLASMSGAPVEAVAPVVDMVEAAAALMDATATSELPPALVVAPVAPAAPAGPNYPQLALYAAAAAAVYCALHYTPAGVAVMELMQSKLVGSLHIHGPEMALLEAIVMLLTSIICVPAVVSLIPGGSPVLGYLIGGALIGPNALGFIHDVNNIKHLAEMGVVFLLFNIGLELSLDRLASMAKQVFGMGSLQVFFTVVGVAAFSMYFAGLGVSSAIILGGALAMSTTAVGVAVLEDRHEMGSRHGRAIFSVLLFQDLAVVVLLMLIPLLAPSPDGASGGMAKIASALGYAAIKAVVCIVAIIVGGRLLIQPLYKKMSEFANAEIFASTTLLVALGTSFLTSLCGLSLALGAFLAGLLIAETEYALQVESDIAPYKGLLMGLFFMSVGMETSGALFVEKWKEVLLGVTLLIAGKLAVMSLIGPWFGLSQMTANRAGLLLAPGGEFAFVAFGVAVSHNVLPVPLTNLLYLVVALSMACTPYLATLGEVWASKSQGATDTKGMQPKEEETKELRDHVIIMGYGRSGQLVAQVLSDNMIPFVALDASYERVAQGKAHNLPVYFGDAGSPAVLHLLGAERAACAIIVLDSPGANYRSVYTMTKNFPGVRTFVRAHDVAHGLNLEKAGATAVVPETLEPSLQLAAAALSNLDYDSNEVNAIINDFRKKHNSSLQELASVHNTAIGYAPAGRA